MRPFLATEVLQMRRLVEAVIPHVCSVQSMAVDAGNRATLVICGSGECKSYTLHPPMNREAILRIASAWETGAYQARQDAPRPVEKIQWVQNASDLVVWARSAKKDRRVAYFDGSVATFRHTGGRQLRALRIESEKRNGKTRGWAKDAMIMERLQERLDLLESVERLRQAGVIDLVQQRKADGEAIYFAVRK